MNISHSYLNHCAFCEDHWSESVIGRLRTDYRGLGDCSSMNPLFLAGIALCTASVQCNEPWVDAIFKHTDADTLMRASEYTATHDDHTLVANHVHGRDRDDLARHIVDLELALSDTPATQESERYEAIFNAPADIAILEAYSLELALRLIDQERASIDFPKI